MGTVLGNHANVEKAQRQSCQVGHRGTAFLQHTHTSGNAPGISRMAAFESGKDNSPNHWTYEEVASWKEEYPECEGQSQSPLDIDTSKLKLSFDGDGSGFYSFANRTNYKALTGRTSHNNFHSVQVDGDFGTIILPIGVFEAKQFHFHFPSEHAIDGMLADGEMHIVHQKVNSKELAVIGILLQDSSRLAHDKDARETRSELGFLSRIGFGSRLPYVGKDLIIDGSVDLNSMYGPLSGPYFYYVGSLTTPPCSEGVHWYVLQHVAGVSQAMIQSFKDVMAERDNRPVQKINERTIVSSKFLR